MVYCPHFYFQASLKTWSDTNVFQPLYYSPAQALQEQIELVRTRLPKRYRWAIHSRPTLPFAYVLLKEKKQFLTGRPIVGHTCSILSRMFSCLSILLLDILKVVWPLQFGELRTPIIWKRILQFFTQSEDVDELIMHNQDLAGFFTSLPKERILLALHHLLLDYCNFTGRHIDKNVISVDVKTNHKFFRLFRGTVKPLQSLGKRPIHLAQISHIVELSFQLTAFEALGTTWKQIRGTAIGGHISPALCCLAIAHHEHTWMINHQMCLQSSRLFAARYVDNRIMCYDANFFNLPSIMELKSSEFYIPPVLLEDEPDIKFLGFMVDFHCRTVTYDVPTELWQFRHPDSAGSTTFGLSGFRSRVALICMYTYPKHLIKLSVDALCSQYERCGYSPELIRKTAVSVQNRIKHVLS